MKTGTVAWFEIPAADLTRAKGFYGELFGWSFEEFGTDYFMAKSSDGMAGGAIYLRKGPAPSGETTTLTFNCDDAERSLDLAIRLGGKSITSKTKISDEMGFFALVEDPEGNKMGFWSQN